MFEINPGLIVWTIITFVCLAFVLAKFAWKPIINMLSQREEKIRSALSEADKARAEAAELMKQHEKNLARAEEEYQKVIREGKALAEKMKDEIVAKAKQQAAQEVARAKEEIKRDIENARKQLKADVVDLAIQSAEKILNESLDAAKQKKLIDSFINQIPKN